MRVRVDTSDKNLPPLRAGMSVEVDVDTGHARGLPHFLTALFGSRRAGAMMAARPRSRQDGNRAGDHRLRDPRHPDAGARHHDRQRRAALHAGQRLGEPGPDRLGADLLYRRRRDHDAADRLSRRPVRAQAPVSRLASPASPSPRCCAAWRSRWSQIVLFRVLQGIVRRGARAALASRAARHLSEGAAGLGDGAVGASR